MEPLVPIFRSFAMIAIIASHAISVAAQSTCGKADTIAVSIAARLGKDQFPAIGLTAKNMGDHALTRESINGPLFPRIHVEGVHGAPQKTQWYHQLTLDYGYPGLMSEGPADPAVYGSGETISSEYQLEDYFYFSEPGPYSVYLEVHDPAETCDPNAKWLRTNTVQIVITRDQVKAWEGRAGAAQISAAIKVSQPLLALAEAPTIQIEFKNDLNTDYEGDDFFPHVVRGSEEVSKTAYYLERLHAPGAREYSIGQGPTPDYTSTRRANSIRAHQSSTWEIDLRNFCKFDGPGKYSTYIEYPDRAGRVLRSNTIEFEITAGK